MNLTRFILAAAVLMLVSWTGRAHAALPPALSIAEIDALQLYIVGAKGCSELPAHGRPACMRGLGTPPSNWDRDLNRLFAQRDVELALAQVWSGEYVCESNGAVLFAGECVNQCTRSAAECADPDRDGLFAYQENQIRQGLDLPASYDIKPCLSGSECSFEQRCARPDLDRNGVADFARSLCLPRTDCQAGACTAFHLVSVAQDDRELILHVYYDYSPQPARVLDLRVQIPVTGLTLSESRLLDGENGQGANNAGKELRTQLSAVGAEQFVRLTVYGTTSSTPIPYGPLVELVFTKAPGANGEVEFSRDGVHRDSSLAPNPVDLRDDLRQDSLWGSGVALAAQGRQLVHYHFDRPEDPARKDGIRSLDELCALASNQPAGSAQAAAYCDLLTSDHRRNRRRISTMRDGALAGVSYVPGVLADGARFTGAGDHLELPIIARADVANGASWSFWFRPDEQRPGAAAEGDHVIWGHTDTAGNLRQALLLQRPEAGTGSAWNLIFQVSPGNTATTTTALGTLTDREWTHLGLTLSANSATVFVNGVASQAISLADTGVACPGTNTDGAMRLDEETPGDRLFVASPTNQLYRIMELDAFGAGAREVRFLTPNGERAIDPGRSSSLDPDFSPLLDKIAFVSTQKQNAADPEGQDVWMANADGTGTVRLTVGFGVPSRGVHVRRPRFSPDGRFLTFESNVFDASAGDNPRQVFRLFALPLDANGGLALSGGQARYADLVRVTPPMDAVLLRPDASFVPRDNWTNLRWLSGTEAIFNVTSRDGRTSSVHRMVLTAVAGAAPAITINQLTPSSSALGQPTVLDARGNGADVAALVLRSGVRFEESATRVGPYVLTVSAGTNGTQVAAVRYEPRSAADLGKPDACWEQNFNYRCDPAENLDGSTENGAPTCSLSDCGPIEVMSLSVGHGSGTVTAEQAGEWLGANGRRAVFRANTSSDGTTTTNSTSIEITAPNGGKPVPPGTLLATLTVQGVTAANVGLRLRRETSALELWSRQGSTWSASSDLGAQLGASEILGGALSPDLTKFVVTAVQQARPVLLRASATQANSPVEKLSVLPSRTEGIDWDKLQPYRACHWLAGVRNTNSGRIEKQARGEFDEVRAYSYLRNAAAMRSEYERGQAWLDKANPSGEQPLAYSCEADLDCGPYQVCKNQECTFDSCGASDPCERGQCTLVASAVDAPATFACTVECESDSQCFSRECYNGPCRFCDADACIECRWNPSKNVAPGVTVGELEGCPDGNRFMCESGSCVSECYSFENGQSRYLCTSNEFCRRGVCVPLEWDWTDLAPATFASLSEAAFDNLDLRESVVKSDYHTIEIEAYGTTDTGYAPQLRVQGVADGKSPYGLNWFEIATVDVDAQVQGARTYKVFTRYDVTKLRFSLVAPPWENPNRAAVGYGNAAELCNARADFVFDADCQNCIAQEGPESPSCAACGTASDCTRMLGTRRRLGYPLHLRDPDVIQQYATSTAERDRYLWTGEPTLVITSVRINGQDKFGQNGGMDSATNHLCRYTRGGTLPADAADTATATIQTLAQKPYAVLNCPDAPITTGGTTRRPELVLLTGALGEPAQPSNVDVRELGNSCFYNLGGAQTGVYPPCFAYEGAPTFDPLSSDAIGYGSIDIGPFTSFGYDKNKLKDTTP